MVYVVPDSLRITPVDPYNTDTLTATAHIKADFLNIYCGGLIDYTKTYIHLLRRNLATGETWTKAQEVSIADCYTQCCLNQNLTTGKPEYGLDYNTIMFETIRSTPVGTYEFMAVDDADFNKISYQADRVAKLKVEIARDPSQVIVPPVVTPGDGGTTTTECASGDYMCLYKDYIPYAIGAVILVLLLTSGKKK